MEKKEIDKTVLSIHQDDPVIWKQVKDFKFEDFDVLNVGYQEETYRSDGGDSTHFYFEVQRMVLETDEEFERRKEKSEWYNKWAKERRRESYLKLKKEFENDGTTET